MPIEMYGYTNKEVILEIRNLSKYYRREKREDKIISMASFSKRKEDIGIREVSFDIHKGVILGITGGRKSGKSTLLKLLSGIIKPSSGSIKKNGIKLDSSQLREMATYISIEHLFSQEYNLTLFENLVQYGFRDNNERCNTIAKVEKLISDFELEDYRFKQVSKLPCTIRGRMFIIRGFLSHKEVLCFDNPLVFIEDSLKESFREYLHELANEGRTVLISSDNESRIKDICHEIITL